MTPELKPMPDGPREIWLLENTDHSEDADDRIIWSPDADCERVHEGYKIIGHYTRPPQDAGVDDCGCGHPDRHRNPSRQEKLGGGFGYYCRYCLTLRTRTGVEQTDGVSNAHGKYAGCIDDIDRQVIDRITGKPITQGDAISSAINCWETEGLLTDAVVEKLKAALRSQEITGGVDTGQLEKRRTETQEWLLENAPYVTKDQKHLDANTPERAYWHYGYMMALRDVLAKATPQPAASDVDQLREKHLKGGEMLNRAIGPKEPPAPDAVKPDYELLKLTLQIAISDLESIHKVYPDNEFVFKALTSAKEAEDIFYGKRETFSAMPYRRPPAQDAVQELVSKLSDLEKAATAVVLASNGTEAQLAIRVLNDEITTARGAIAVHSKPGERC